MYRLALIRIVCLKNPFDLPNIPEFAFYHWKFRMEKLVLKVKQIPNLESKSSYMNIYFFFFRGTTLFVQFFSICQRFNPWVRKTLWRRKWQPTPVFLPGESQGWMSLVDYNPWGCKESDVAEQTNTQKHTHTGRMHSFEDTH